MTAPLNPVLGGTDKAAIMVMLLAEAVRGKPLPERFQMAVMQSGLLLLLGLSVVLIVRDTSQLPLVQQLTGR